MKLKIQALIGIILVLIVIAAGCGKIYATQTTTLPSTKVITPTSTIATLSIATTTSTITSTAAISIPATDYSEIVTFPDPALEQAIRDAIGKPTGDIYQSDLDKLTDFSAINMCTDNFQDLTGIERCVNLQSLEIQALSMNIDLTPLESLHKLKSLQLFTSTMILHRWEILPD